MFSNAALLLAACEVCKHFATYLWYNPVNNSSYDPSKLLYFLGSSFPRSLFVH